MNKEFDAAGVVVDALRFSTLPRSYSDIPGWANVFAALDLPSAAVAGCMEAW